MGVTLIALARGASRRVWFKGYSRRVLSLALLVLTAVSTACASRPPLPPSPAAGVAGVEPRTTPLGTPVPQPTARGRVLDGLDTRVALETAAGEATYYASFFDGRRTASGIVFSNAEPWAAHRTWPFGTVVRVTNERNGRSVVLTVVDRLPPATTDRARRTVIDLSQSAAAELDFLRDGRVPVLVEVLEWGGS